MNAIEQFKRATILDRLTATFQIAEQIKLAEARQQGKFEYCLCGQKTIMPDANTGGPFVIYCSVECATHYRMIGTQYDDGSYFGVAAPQHNEVL